MPKPQAAYWGIESNRSPQLLQPAEFWCAGGAAVLNDEALKASWLVEVEEIELAFWQCVRNW